MSKKKKYYRDENKEVSEIEEEPKKSNGFSKIIPLKDWHIKQNEYDIILKEGIEIEVPDLFLAPLKSEKVI